MQDDDEALADSLTARLLDARKQLLAEMAQRGFRPDDGWRIHEELVNTPGGTAYVLRAVHRVHPSGPDLAVSVPVPG